MQIYKSFAGYPIFVDKNVCMLFIKIRSFNHFHQNWSISRFYKIKRIIDYKY